MLTTSDPFFLISTTLNGKRIHLHRSEIVKGDCNPTWKPFTLNISDVGGFDTLFTVESFAANEDGTKKLIGEFSTTLREWSFGPYQEALVNPAKQKSFGAFSVDKVEQTCPVPRPVPPAYQITMKGVKLDKKDGLFGTGSSGLLFGC